MQITAPLAIVLDTTPLGLLSQKAGVAEADACKAWYVSLLQVGCRFFVPEIADYELRREFLRTGKTAAIARLDTVSASDPDRYLPLSTPDVRLAARLWAQARNRGVVTAPPDALNSDVLIAAQALRLVPADFGLSGMVVATANPSHLSALTTAALWSTIQP